MNAGFGAFIAAGLWLIGIPKPFLWGAVAGLMQFVPFIGAYIAAAFPMVLALFAVSEPLMGHVFEPWVFGHSTGLAPIAVVGAAAFWTWLWGPIGLLLAVPLTVCLVVMGRHVEQLGFLEVMLGDQPALAPEKTFYQRAIADDVDAMAEQAETCLRSQRLPGYLDGVALPALALAQTDAARGALSPERQGCMERSVLALLEDVEEADEATAAKGGAEEQEANGTASVPVPWREPGAVLCLPGRGPFDALLATMAGQALARRGFGVQVGGRGTMPGVPPRLLCFCFLEGGASGATARYLLRRSRRQWPDVPAVALAWSRDEDGAVASALEAERRPAPALLARSIGETVEAAVATAGTDAEPGAARGNAPVAETPPPGGGRAAVAAAAARDGGGFEPPAGAAPAPA